MRIRASVSWLLLLAVAATAPSSAVRAEPAALRPFRFAPHSTPQAQLAGYYVALERGFYRERGLDVAILGGAPASAPRQLEDGRADVASMWLVTALEERDRGVPLVNVAQLVGRSSLMVVAKTSSGIREPRDLEGRKVGVWEDDLSESPREFLQHYGITAQLVPLGSTVNLFLRGGVDATIALWSNEYHTILNAGVEPSELTTFFFRDHDLNFPEEGLYCRADDLERDASGCRAFVEASLEGWREAFAHPEPAVALVMKHMIEAHLGTNAAHQSWMLARMGDLMEPSPGSSAGVLSPGDYRRTAEALRAGGAIAAVPLLAEFHRPLFSTP